MTLKLRLSTTLGDVKLPVYSKDTIGIAKKKLQVCNDIIHTSRDNNIAFQFFIFYLFIFIFNDCVIVFLFALFVNVFFSFFFNLFIYRVKRASSHQNKGGFLAVNFLVTKCTLKRLKSILDM